MSMTHSPQQWQSLWQQQCQVWLDSINRNREQPAVSYDFDAHRLTLVPRTCWLLHSGHMEWMNQEISPITDSLQRSDQDYDVRLDVTYCEPSLKDPSRRWDLRIDRVWLYLDGAEAITHLALTVDRDLLVLEGGMGRKDP